MSFEEARFYVYVHYRKDNGKPFYVGQGTRHRYKYSYGRSNAWKIVEKSAGGFVPVVIEEGLTKDQALELEEFLIEEMQNVVVNSVSSKSEVKEISFEEFNDRYYVDESSPTGLRYKIDVFAHNKDGKLHSMLAKAGDVAGSKQQDGWQISWNRKSYRVHRVVYLLSFGTIGKHFVVDHIDGDCFNNKISNLRLVTQSENVRNRKIAVKNKLGVQGVSIINPTKGCKAARAAITIYGKRIEKSFSFAKYGEDSAIQMAIAFRREMELKAKNQGVEYTDRHCGLNK